MATTCIRTVQLAFSGQIDATLPFTAATNAASPAQSDLVTLASGANTLTKPAGGSMVTALTIIPPAGNTVALTLKGVTGDTGIPLHLTDPTSLALASGATSVCLTAAAGVTGVRLIWS